MSKINHSLVRLFVVSFLVLTFEAIAYAKNSLQTDFADITTTNVATVRFDFDGDRKADVSIFRPSDGSWWISNSGGSGVGVGHFGQNGDEPVAADYDGDGKYDLAVYRGGVWNILGSRNNVFSAISFGLASDLPVPADFDGDLKSDIAVFRPSDGTWYILRSSDQAFYAYRLGSDGDVPLPADFDGDGKADINLFRGSEGNWYRINSGTGSLTVSHFGSTGDIPVQGDFDGDLKNDIAVWRPSTGVWWIQRSSDSGITAVAFGLPSDTPVPADYDGDGRTDIAVFRNADGVWHQIDSSTSSYHSHKFGDSSDIPVSKSRILTSATPTVPTINCTWYVATTGLRTNAGTQTSPWSLAHALSGANGVIRPGNTICILGGTYPGRYVPTLNGSANQPIIVRSYPGQRVVIDGGLPISATSSDTGTAAPYADSFFSLSSYNNVQIGSTIRIGTENMQVSSINYQTGVMRVVRGWGGSCATGTCVNWPSGSTVSTYYGILDVAGSYTWIWGLELTNTAHVTRIETAGTIDKGTGLTDQCQPGCKFINNVVHNTAAGIASQNGNSSGNEYYGNILFLNGWDGTGLTGDPGKGHGMYIQNLLPTNLPKKINDNLSFMNFGFNMQAYSDNGGINNLEYTGNAFFESSNPVPNGPTYNVLIGGGNQNFVGFKFLSNFTYNPTINGIRRGTDVIGWGDSFCTSPVAQDNYLASGNFGLSINCATPVITGNTFYTLFSGANLFPSNTFFTTRPNVPKIYVRPNAFEPGRGHIIVYNWNRASTVNVDLSSLGLSIGQRFQVRDAENFNGPPVYSGIYNGSSVVIPMTNTATSPVYGTVNKLPTHSDMEFDAFVVLPF